MTASASDGEPVVLPPLEYLETVKVYRGCMATLLTEERERERMRVFLAKDSEERETLTDEQYRAGLDELARESLEQMSDIDLEHELRRRRDQRS